MDMTAEKIVTEALGLSPQARAFVAERLIKSFQKSLRIAGMNPIRFHPVAESEMIDAAAWYEAKQVGLSWRYLSSVRMRSTESS
jgi:hypothetical protein